MLDFIAPKLTDEGAKALGEGVKALAEGGAAALNTSSAKVVSWAIAICAVGYISIKLIRELRGGTVEHVVTHRGPPPPSPPRTT
jgi:hypothetical protein